MNRDKKNKSEKTAKPSQFRKAAVAAGIEAQVGKGAVKAEYRAAISASAPWTHTESLDLDAHFERSEPNECRWDYGVGIKHGAVELVLWIEPHPASSTGEVRRLVEKVTWLKNKLDMPAFGALKELTKATVREGHIPYRWLHSGSLQIARGSKEARALALAGIEFPARKLNLPS